VGKVRLRHPPDQRYKVDAAYPRCPQRNPGADHRRTARPHQNTSLAGTRARARARAQPHRRKTNPADTQPGVPKGVRDHTTSVHIEVERATADHQTQQPTSREWGEVAAQLTSATNNTSRMFEYYLASIDSTLKSIGPYLAQVNGLGPSLAQVNKTLERIEQRLRPEVPPTPLAAEEPRQLESFQQLRVVPTPHEHSPAKAEYGLACEIDVYISIGSPTRPRGHEQPSGPSVIEHTTLNTSQSNPDMKQGTIVKYLRKKGTASTMTKRESGSQPTPHGETLVTDGPATPPRDSLTPRRHSPESAYWGAGHETHGPSTRPPVNEQPSGPADTADTSDDNDIHRESGAQPTPHEETLDATGSDTRPSDVSLPHGHGPEMFEWGVDRRYNTYQ